MPRRDHTDLLRRVREARARADAAPGARGRLVVAAADALGSMLTASRASGVPLTRLEALVAEAERLLPAAPGADEPWPPDKGTPGAGLASVAQSGAADAARTVDRGTTKLHRPPRAPAHHRGRTGGDGAVLRTKMAAVLLQLEVAREMAIDPRQCAHLDSAVGAVWAAAALLEREP